MEDSRIIELFSEGSDRAPAEAEKKYGAHCTRIAMNILGQQDEAETCVRNTWAEARKAAPPAGSGKLGVFLGRITRELALDRWKILRGEKRGSRETAIVLREMEECAADADSAEWPADRSVLTGVLNRFLESLPTSQRNVFVRRYWYFDTVRDIADAYDMTESRVQTILLRERRELARMLGKEAMES